MDILQPGFQSGIWGQWVTASVQASSFDLYIPLWTGRQSIRGPDSLTISV